MNNENFGKDFEEFIDQKIEEDLVTKITNRLLAVEELKEFLSTIQNILKQLEQDVPDATEAEKIEHVNIGISSSRKKVIDILKILGDDGTQDCIERHLTDPYANITKAVFKSWK